MLYSSKRAKQEIALPEISLKAKSLRFTDLVDTLIVLLESVLSKIKIVEGRLERKISPKMLSTLVHLAQEARLCLRQAWDFRERIPKLEERKELSLEDWLDIIREVELPSEYAKKLIVAIREKWKSK